MHRRGAERPAFRTAVPVGPVLHIQVAVSVAQRRTHLPCATGLPRRAGETERAATIERRSIAVLRIMAGACAGRTRPTG
jgi:hypothetical protein